MKIAIIGLGNPGLHYQHTRHNVGFWLVDQFACNQGVKFAFQKKYNSEIVEFIRKDQKVFLIKPFSFMNESGKNLKKLLSISGCGCENAILVHDELNLPLSGIKISHGKGTGGHNGVKSVVESLGAPLTRVRIGIGEKHAATQNLADYVLTKFTVDEKARLFERTPHFLNAINSILDDGIEKAMNFFNQKKLINTSS